MTSVNNSNNNNNNNNNNLNSNNFEVNAEIMIKATSNQRKMPKSKWPNWISIILKANEKALQHITDVVKSNQVACNWWLLCYVAKLL